MDISISSTSNLPFNRSFSAPDISTNGPLFRRVVIEEQYFSNNQSSRVSYTTLLATQRPTQFPLSIGATNYPTRHFSCDQLAGLSDETVNSTFANSSTVKTHGAHTSTPLKIEPLLAVMPQDSPMDVDCIEIQDCQQECINKTQIKTKKGCGLDPNIANKAPKATILDFVDLTFQGTTPVLKKRLPKKKKKSYNGNSSQFTAKSKSYFTKFNITIFLIAVFCVPLYDRLNYNRDIDLDTFESQLMESIIGQTHVVDEVLNAMYSFKRGQSDMEKHLLTLIGTTGVGKTHCVNIIKRRFMPKQIVELSVSTFDVSTYKDHLNLHKSVPYLVIFDDLRYKHITKLSEILDLLPNNKWVLVMAVFNIQDTDDFRSFSVNETLYDKIIEELSPLSFEFRAVKFNSFHADFAKIYADRFAHVYFDIVGNISNWRELLGNHDFETFGFKGLFEKINIWKK